MLDMQAAYAFNDQDETTVEEQDVPVIPIRPRTATDGALTMQVYKGAHWHRRMPDLATTACGVPIHSQFDPVRREEICLPLCTECFSKYELHRAALNLAKENDNG